MAKKKNKGEKEEDKKEVGRPSEFSEDYIHRVYDYLENCKDSINNDKIKVNLPTIQGYARFIGVSKVSLYAWEKENTKFMNALDKIRIEQRSRLINNGLSGDYNPTIAKLILSSNHDMREKTDQTSDGKAISNEVTVTFEDFSNESKTK